MFERERLEVEDRAAALADRTDYQHRWGELDGKTAERYLREHTAPERP
jgi:hypothetical protein